MGPHLLPDACPVLLPPRPATPTPGSFPVVQRGSLFQGPGSQAPKPRTGLLTSEKGQFLQPPPTPGPLEEIWLPVSSKPELDQVSVCLGNSRKETSVQGQSQRPLHSHTCCTGVIQSPHFLGAHSSKSGVSPPAWAEPAGKTHRGSLEQATSATLSGNRSSCHV